MRSTLCLAAALVLNGVLIHVDSFSQNPYYYDHWCDNEGSASLQYLDDSKCAKVNQGHLPLGSLISLWTPRTRTPTPTCRCPSSPPSHRLLSIAGIPVVFQPRLDMSFVHDGDQIRAEWLRARHCAAFSRLS